MPLYEEYTKKNRDAYKSLQELRESYSVSYPEDFNFAYDVLDKMGTETPDKLAMLWVSNEQEEKCITFGDMKRWSDKAANLFTSLGIEKGDFVMLVLKRSYLFWYCMMGLHKIGAVGVQATNLLTAKDYKYRCNAAGIKMALITADGDCTAHFDEVQPECETIKIKAVTKHKDAGEGWLDFEALLEAASENWKRPTGEKATKATDIMIMSFSSGTTGYPKMVSHDFTYPLGHIMTGVFWHRVIDNGMHFTISDTGWMKSMWGKMYGQWLGGTALFTYDFEKFSGADILRVIAKYKVTTFCAPPTMYRFMLLEDMTQYDLSSLVHCCTAGEALNPDIFNSWEKYTGLQIYEGFGQSETTVCCGVLYPHSEPKPGAMGLPMPGYDLFVSDEDGNKVAPGVTGEICIRATLNDRPCGLYMGYFRNEEDTARAWRGGLYHTGDMAYSDEQGYLWYVGRGDDIIKSSGYRIGPFEVESVLLEHPAVLETAVTGVPDPLRGFNVKATIVLSKGYEPSEALVKDIQNYVKTNTAPYKYPRVVEFVDALPKTTSGKIRRMAIRNQDAEK